MFLHIRRNDCKRNTVVPFLKVEGELCPSVERLPVVYSQLICAVIVTTQGRLMCRTVFIQRGFIFMLSYIKI